MPSGYFHFPAVPQPASVLGLCSSLSFFWLLSSSSSLSPAVSSGRLSCIRMTLSFLTQWSYAPHQKTSVLAVFSFLDRLRFSYLFDRERMSVGCVVRIKAMCARWKLSDGAGRHKMKSVLSSCLPMVPLPTGDPVNTLFYVRPFQNTHSYILFYSIPEKNVTHGFARLSVHLSCFVYPNEMICPVLF